MDRVINNINSQINNSQGCSAQGSGQDTVMSETDSNAIAASLAQARVSTSAPGKNGPSGSAFSSGLRPSPISGEKTSTLSASPKDDWPEVLKAIEKLSREDKVNFIFQCIGEKKYFSLKRLFEVGLNPTTLVHKERSYSLLHHAIVNRNNPMVDECLALKRCKLNSKCINNYTPLYLAASQGDLDSVKKLLAMPETDVNMDCDNWEEQFAQTLMGQKKISENNLNRTALQIAIKNNHNEVAKLILDFEKCDYNKKDTMGVNSFFYAVLFNNEEMAEALLSKKDLNVNDVDLFSGRSALIVAVSNKNADMLGLLLKCKELNVNVKDHMGMTALHIAKLINQPEIVNALISKGAEDYGSIFEHIPMAL